MKCLLMLILALSCLPATAEQYRSKIYLDPSLKMDESVEQSLAELEAQLSSMEDSYAKSSASRQLAAHYASQGAFDKAADYYETALQASGLSEVVNIEILKQLLVVYLRLPNYPKVITTFERLEQLQEDLEPNLLLVLAQAHNKTKNHLEVERTLQRLMKQIDSLDATQLRQALALYYKAGNYSRSETILKRLVNLEPEEPTTWLQLTSILLAQDKKREALDQLALASEKQVPLKDSDWMLLASLFIGNGAAEKGARVLEQAIERGDVEGSADNYRSLFEAWLRARERPKAIAALKVAANINQSTELYLYLAQLQMEQQRWQAMEQAVRQACQKVLKDQFVSRANLLLGISLYKQGKSVEARRAIINANLIGYSEKAKQWLRFIKAEPTRREMSKVTGPCRPKNANVRVSGRHARIEVKPQPAPKKAPPSDPKVLLKTVAGQMLFTSKQRMPGDQISSKITPLAGRLGTKIVMGGGSIDGPLMILFEETDSSQTAANSKEEVEFRLAFPVRGSPRASGRFKLEPAAPFKAAYRAYEGPGAGLNQAWLDLYTDIEKSNLTPSGQRRMILGDKAPKGNHIRVELQIGVKK